MLHFLFALVLLSTIAVSESSTPIYCPPLGQVNSSAAQNLASSTPSPTLNSTQNQTVSGDEQDDVKLPELYIVIAGSLAFLVTFPFAVYHIPRVALESTGAVLIGSCLMVLLGVLTQSDVFEILGKSALLSLASGFPSLRVITRWFDGVRAARQAGEPDDAAAPVRHDAHLPVPGARGPRAPRAQLGAPAAQADRHRGLSVPRDGAHVRAQRALHQRRHLRAHHAAHPATLAPSEAVRNCELTRSFLTTSTCCPDFPINLRVHKMYSYYADLLLYKIRMYSDRCSVTSWSSNRFASRSRRRPISRARRQCSGTRS